MQFEPYYQLLARSDVKELALQTSRPPCVLIAADYHPVANRAATEDEILALLAETGSAEMLGLMDGHRKWNFEHPVIGTINVSAGYHGDRLQARLKRDPAVLARQSARLKQQPTGFSASSSISDASFATPDDTGAEPLGAVEFAAPPARRKPIRDNLFRTRDEPPPQPPEDDLFAAPDETVPANDAGPDSLPVPSETVPALSAVTLADGLDLLLRAARERDASDLHILADRAPTLRIAGDLVSMGNPLDASLVEQMLLSIVPERVRSDLDQHGACDFALQTARYGRFRVNITRQRTGYKMTARPILTTIPTLVELGLPAAIGTATDHHQGLIVVTGPTGHGKTTTLAAIVDLINAHKAHHIITVEDPIEFVHPRKLSMMSQREVGTHTKKFAAALKGSLREDPDVIVVGELRDTETVRMALSASETGHLVISTMNTPSAAKAIERLIDLFPPGDQPQVRLTLAGGLRLVISQRLVPNADRSGMVAAVELLPGSPPLWALIRDGKTFQIPSLQQRGKALGIVRLDDSLADLVRSGKTTLENARPYAENPGDFDAVVSGKNVRGGEEMTIDSFDPTQAAAQAAKDKAKDVFSRAGKFFGNDNKK